MWKYNYALNVNELCHYGVKGMKWGVTRESTSFSKAENKRRKMELAKNNMISYKSDKNKYKHAKKDYKNAKKDYKNELLKRNEKYSERLDSFDATIIGRSGRDKVNKLLNSNKNMTVSEARQKAYTIKGRETVVLMMTSAIAGHVLRKKILY